MKGLKVFSVLAALALTAVGVQAGPLADATADSLWGIELGGYVDVSFSYNFNDPIQNGGNNGRIFDTDHNEFNVHGFQFYMDKLPEDVGEAGFRIDTFIGEDSNLIVSDPLFDFGDEFNIYQAYVSYIAPLGNGLTIDFGRFATWHGYEVIESPANDNFSRSFLFGFAIPFTHTGIRASYPINDQWEVSGGVTQGWDNVEDDNDAKTFHGAVWWTPMETLFIGNSVAYGPENHIDFTTTSLDRTIQNSSDGTLLYDFVATYNLADFNMEQVTLGANFDWAQEEDGDLAGDDAEWWGVAGYIRYDVNDQAYVALRGEFFDDSDATRFPIVNPAVTAGSDSIEVWEITATLGYNLTDNLQSRLEYRHDDADDDVFFDEEGSSSFEDSQDTIALEVIYSF